MGKNTSVYFDYTSREFVGLDSDTLNYLRLNYVGVDIEREIKAMGAWLVAKGGKRKGTLGFIVNWLNNATPQTSIQSKQELLEDSPLSEPLAAYLEELWTNCRHILDMNRI